MKIAKYQDVLDFLYSQLPMYQRVGNVAYRKDLTNIKALCQKLDNPQDKIQTIHVGGTNGKGTVSHLIAYILQKQGLKVGIYTSPHYVDFRERIKINGEYIGKRDVVEFVDSSQAMIQEIQPSFFEITVAMAFDYFAKKEVDYAIIEVGLGGRLDSTNIIAPLLSIITNISLDHTSMLGNTLQKIAFEKAGIIKEGIPVVIGETQPEVESVFKNKAKEVNAPISYADQAVFASKEDGHVHIQLNGKHWMTLHNSPLLSDFQLKNIVTAFGGCLKLKDIEIDWIKVLDEFKDFPSLTGYMGRWQFLSQRPDILIDSAHNEAGIRFLTKFLEEENHYSKQHIILGFANDKELNDILNLFPKNAKYYFVKANVPRGLNANLLKQKAADFGLFGKSYSSVRKALSSAKVSAHENDLIFVGGSIFVVAEVLV